MGYGIVQGLCTQVIHNGEEKAQTSRSMGSQKPTGKAPPMAMQGSQISRMEQLKTNSLTEKATVTSKSHSPRHSGPCEVITKLKCLRNGHPTIPVREE